MQNKISKINDFMSTCVYVSDKYDTLKSQEQSKTTKDVRKIANIIKKVFSEKSDTAVNAIDSLFSDFFAANTKYILLSPFCDTWLRKGGPKIVLDEKKGGLRLSIGILYNNTISIREMYEDDNKNYRESNYEFLMLPISYLLSLYQLAYEYIPDSKLEIYISQLKFVLDNKPPDSGDSIVKTIKEFAQGVGLDLSSMPNDFNFSDIMKDDSPAKQMISPLMGQLRDLMSGNANPDAISNLVNSLKNNTALPPQASELLNNMNITDMLRDASLSNK